MRRPSLGAPGPRPPGPTYYCLLDTAFDRLLLVGSARALFGLYVATHPRCPRRQPEWVERVEPFEEARRQLTEYFAGHRRSFDLPVELVGTPFQRSVWDRIRSIGFGETLSYKELATQIGQPAAARAVGGATGRNPVSIIVPCHRVVGSDGSLTGYGWGPRRKTWLLAHEGIWG